MVSRTRILTFVIVGGMFGGLIGGPIVSLIYYDSSPEERFYLFMVPEIIGFIFAGLMVYFGKVKK